MKSEAKLNFDQTRLFEKLFLDFVNQVPSLDSFSNGHATHLQNWKKVIEKRQFSFENRKVLHGVLTEQYEKYKLNRFSTSQIDALLEQNTYTVTTGHQLCLFTGSLYFVYKIISTIKLADELKKQFPDYHFVPIYWMASEDHDFEEINHFNLFDKTFKWQTTQKGAVGRMQLEGLDFDLLKTFDIPADMIDFYRQAKDLAHATAMLVDYLFGKYGLLVLNPDDAKLKKVFAPYIQVDFEQNISYHKTKLQSQLLEELGYKIQVNPREINFFYLEKDTRERIIVEDHLYKINNTSLSFKKDEWKQWVQNNPEKISPNVVTRSLYQEVILPNLAYVGGPGELSYWLQYKLMFEAYGVPFPILVPRVTAIILKNNQIEKLHNLGLSIETLFLEDHQIKQIYLQIHSDSLPNFDNEKAEIAQNFNSIKTKLIQQDKTLEGFAAAQWAEMTRILDNIEKKSKKIAEQKEVEQLNIIFNIKKKCLPNGQPQDRVVNFLNFYINQPDFIDQIMAVSEPLNFRLQVWSQ